MGSRFPPIGKLHNRKIRQIDLGRFAQKVVNPYEGIPHKFTTFYSKRDLPHFCS